VNGAKPPLYVGLGARRGVQQNDALDECRKRGWAMLTPFAADAKGVLQAIDAVAGRVDVSRIYLKGDAQMASVALETLAAAPRRFAGVSVVMPGRAVKGLDRARGCPLDVTAPLKGGGAQVALAAFGEVSDAAVPPEVAAAVAARTDVPAAFRFSGENADFPSPARPLAYQLEANGSRLSITDTHEVYLFAPSFSWFEGLARREYDGRRRLILAGDSTLQRRKPNDKAGSWGEALAGELSEDFAIENCAIGGRSTKTYMDEWKTNVVNRIRPGDWVIVQFGHNDMSKASDPTVDRETDPDTEYMNNLLRFVADVKYRGGQPLLVTPISLYLYRKDPNTWPSWDPLARWVAAMKRVAREHRVPVVDLHELTAAALREAGGAASSKWFMFSLDGTDWAHPTRLGARRFAQLFADHVRRTGHPAKALLCAERPPDRATVRPSASDEVPSGGVRFRGKRQQARGRTPDLAERKRRDDSRLGRQGADGHRGGDADGWREVADMEHRRERQDLEGLRDDKGSGVGKIGISVEQKPPCAITANFDILLHNLRKKRLRYGRVYPVAS